MPVDYDKLLQPLLEKMEQGQIPWKRDWMTLAPRNLISGADYRGINYLILFIENRTDPRWCTFLQAKELGGSVRKGEKGTGIVKYGTAVKSREENGETVVSGYRYLTAYTVFNFEQIDWPENGITKKHSVLAEGTEHTRIDSLELVYERMKNRPALTHGGEKACYVPMIDTVRMPEISRFATIEGYYATLWHELGHSTGHKDRLNRREGFVECDKTERGEEELVAEMTSYFVAANTSIQIDEDNAAAYCRSWYTAVKKDPKILISAASKAQKAADYILGREENYG